jgi:hypothetical protein
MELVLALFLRGGVVAGLAQTWEIAVWSEHIPQGDSDDDQVSPRCRSHRTRPRSSPGDRWSLHRVWRACGREHRTRSQGCRAERHPTPCRSSAVRKSRTPAPRCPFRFSRGPAAAGSNRLVADNRPMADSGPEMLGPAVFEVRWTMQVSPSLPTPHGPVNETAEGYLWGAGLGGELGLRRRCQGDAELVLQVAAEFVLALRLS